MRRTSLDLDDALVDQAARILGTAGPSAAVRAALEEVVRRPQREGLAAWVPNLDPGDLESLRAPRTT
jgi:Arc/MetJ family transcription regulator